MFDNVGKYLHVIVFLFFTQQILYFLEEKYLTFELLRTNMVIKTIFLVHF